MSITINGKPIVHGKISMPRYGAWHARLMVDCDAASDVTGSCSIAVEGGATLTCASFRVGDFEGRISVWVVGGTNGLGDAVVGKFYDAAPVQTIIGDIARECGETISSTADTATLQTLLPKWMRMEGSAGRALAMLTTHIGVPWRMIDDGSIWLGPETYAAFSGDYDLIDTDPTGDTMTIADELVALRPGMSLDGRNVDYVEHTIGEETLRTVAFLA